MQSEFSDRPIHEASLNREERWRRIRMRACGRKGVCACMYVDGTDTTSTCFLYYRTPCQHLCYANLHVDLHVSLVHYAGVDHLLIGNFCTDPYGQLNLTWYNNEDVGMHPSEWANTGVIVPDALLCTFKAVLGELAQVFQQISKEVHQKDNISRILWYSDWLHNTTSAGNSIFVTNHNTTSCGRSIMQPIRLEYEKWYMEAYILMIPIVECHYI